MEKFTEKALEAAAYKSTASKRPNRICDGKGLYLQVAAGNTKSWLFRYMLRGRSHEMGLGAVGAEPDGVTLAEARRRAARCRALLSEGLNPLGLRRRIMPTIADSAETQSDGVGGVARGKAPDIPDDATFARPAALREAVALLVSRRQVSPEATQVIELKLLTIVAMIASREKAGATDPKRKALRIAVAKLARCAAETADALGDPALAGSLLEGGTAAWLLHRVAYNVGHITPAHLHFLAEEASRTAASLPVRQGSAGVGVVSGLPRGRLACAIAVVRLIEIFDGHPPGRNSPKALALCSLVWQQVQIEMSPPGRLCKVLTLASWERHLKIALGQSREVPTVVLKKMQVWVTYFVEAMHFRDLACGSLPD